MQILPVQWLDCAARAQNSEVPSIDQGVLESSRGCLEVGYAGK